MFLGTQWGSQLSAVKRELLKCFTCNKMSLCDPQSMDVGIQTLEPLWTLVISSDFLWPPPPSKLPIPDVGMQE